MPNNLKPFDIEEYKARIRAAKPIPFTPIQQQPTIPITPGLGLDEEFWRSLKPPAKPPAPPQPRPPVVQPKPKGKGWYTNLDVKLGGVLPFGQPYKEGRKYKYYQETKPRLLDLSKPEEAAVLQERLGIKGPPLPPEELRRIENINAVTSALGFLGAGPVTKFATPLATKVTRPVTGAVQKAAEAFRALPKPVKIVSGIGAGATAEEVVRGTVVPKAKEQTYPAKIGAGLRTGVGEILETTGGTMQWKGKKNLGNRLTKMGETLKKDYEVPYGKPVTWKSYLDPDYWATTIAQSTPFMASLVPLMYGGWRTLGPAAMRIALKAGVPEVTAKTAGEIAGAVGGGTLSRFGESMMEAGGAYQESQQMGMSPQESDKVAKEVFKNNMRLAGMDTMQLLVLFGKLPLKNVLGKIGKAGIVTKVGAKVGKAGKIGAITKAGGKVAFGGLTEAAEEMYQEAIQQRALGLDGRSLIQQILRPNERTKEAGYAGGAFGLMFGGASVITDYAGSRAAQKISPEAETKILQTAIDKAREGISPDKISDAVLDEVMGDRELSAELGNVIKQAADETVNELHSSEYIGDPAIEQLRQVYRQRAEEAAKMFETKTTKTVTEKAAEAGEITGEVAKTGEEIAPQKEIIPVETNYSKMTDEELQTARNNLPKYKNEMTPEQIKIADNIYNEQLKRYKTNVTEYNKEAEKATSLKHGDKVSKVVSGLGIGAEEYTGKIIYDKNGRLAVKTDIPDGAGKKIFPIDKRWKKIEVKEEVAPPTKKVTRELEGWHTPIIPGQEAKTETQASGLPKGKFISLDKPFESDAHDISKTKKVKVSVKNVFDPDGLLDPENAKTHKKISTEMVEELNKQKPQDNRQFMTDYLKGKGFDAYIRGIDGDVNNRELIVFGKEEIAPPSKETKAGEPVETDYSKMTDEELQTARNNLPKYKNDMTSEQIKIVKDINKEQLKRYKAKVKPGEPIIAYYGTTRAITKFDLSEFQRGSSGGLEFGPHFGSQSQVHAEGMNIVPVRLYIKNPVILPDSGTWTASAIRTALELHPEETNLTKEQVRRIKKISYDLKLSAREELSKIKEYLQELGYDGIQYENKVEGSGTSYIPFSAEQVKNLFKGKEKKEVAPPTSKEATGKETKKPKFTPGDRVTWKNAMGETFTGTVRGITANGKLEIETETPTKQVSVVDPDIPTLKLIEKEIKEPETKEAVEKEVVEGEQVRTSEGAEKPGAGTAVQGNFTGLDHRIPLRSIERNEYGSLIVTRGKATEKGKEYALGETVSKALRPHQKDGVNLAIAAIDNYSGFVLADGTGAGKTMQELAVANYYANKGHSVLIVTPNRGIISTAFMKDAKILGVKIKELSGENQQVEPGTISITTYASLDKLTNRPEYIIFDESHYLKNYNSKQSRRGVGLAANARGVLFASATPLDKAEHIFYLKKLGIFEKRRFNEVMQDLGYESKMRTVRTKYGKKEIQTWERAVPLEEAASRFERFFDELANLGLLIKREVSMDKVDVYFHSIDLPEEAYEQLRNVERFYEEKYRGNVVGLAKAQMLMAQRRFQEPHKIEDVYNFTMQELKAGRQVVIFASRIEESELAIDQVVYDKSEGTLKTLTERFEKEGYPVARIFGAGNIDKEIQKFQEGKAKIALVTPQKGGAGLSLDDIRGNAPRTMIIMTAPFSGAENVQVAGRINRLNTKSRSRIIYLLANTNVDEWNKRIIAEKMKTLHAAVKGDIKKLEIHEAEKVELPTREPEKEPEVKTGKPIIEGKTVTVKTEKQTPVQIRYAVVDANDMTVSHDINLHPNKNYPQELQPRDRTRIATEDQVHSILTNLEPEWLGENPKASEGAPIVGPDLVVEAGNGRIIALQRGYKHNHPNIKKYKEWLLNNAEKFGLNKEAVEKINNPVLVRVRETNVDRAKFAEETNIPSVAALSATEQAVTDAKKLTGNLLSIFRPGENGEILTLANQDFIEAFMRDVVSPNERGKYVTAKGKLSQEGITRIKNAIFASAYKDISTIEKLAESTDNNVRNITNAMLIAAPEMAKFKEGVAKGNYYNLDITPDIVAAMNKLSHLRETGQSIDNYLIQEALFGEDISQEGKALLSLFNKYKRNTKKIVQLLNSYIEAAKNAGSPNQLSMFGKHIPNKADIFAVAVKGVEGVYEVPSLFEGEPSGGKQVTEGNEGKVPAEGEKGRTTENKIKEEAEADISSEEEIYPLPEYKPKAELENWLSSAEDAAKKRIAEKKNKFEQASKKLDEAADRSRNYIRNNKDRMYSGIPADLIYHHAVIAASKIAKGGLNFAQLTTEMVKEFGEHVKPYMEEIWRKANAILAQKFTPEQLVSQLRLSLAGIPTEPRILPTFYSQLYETIVDKMPNISTPEQVKGIIKGSNIPAEEIKWSGIEDWLAELKGKVEKDNVLRYLNYSSLETEEKTSKTNIYSEYVLPGGKNYRELMFILPEWIVDRYWSPHYPEQNVFAHVRFDDRIDSEDNKVLFIEEVQSDWHQAGRKEGYVVGKKAMADKIAREYGLSLPSDQWSVKALEQAGVPDDLIAQWYDALRAFRGVFRGDIVPDAPFQKTWHEFVIKRMLRYAAENNYDKIAWTTGKQQAERYGISEKGMEGFYDHILPQFMDKYGKRWGVKTEKLDLSPAGTVHSFAITPEMCNSVLFEGQPLFSSPSKRGLDEAERKALERIKSRKGRLMAGLPFDDLIDYAIVGAVKITKGVVKFSAWSAEMIHDYGEQIKPYLKQIWDKAKEILEKGPEAIKRKESGKLSGGEQSLPFFSPSKDLCKAGCQGFTVGRRKGNIQKRHGCCRCGRRSV